MKKLWIFGDSYSEPFSKYNSMQWKPEYVKWKGYVPKYYGEFISDELKIQLVNSARGGSDNYTIFESIIPFLYKISPDDIIIIGWSHTIRFRVVNKIDEFNTIRPSSLDVVFDINRRIPYLDLSNETLREITVNRNSKNYISEVNNYIKFINFAFSKNKIIHWSPFCQDKEGLNATAKSLDKYETINKETLGSVSDEHFSENTHKDLAYQFIDLINNYKYSQQKESLI